MIKDLQRRASSLKKTLSLVQKEKDNANVELQDSLERRNLLSNQNLNISETRKIVEHSISELKSKLPSYERGISNLERKEGEALATIEYLQDESNLLEHQNQRFQDRLRERGLQLWVRSSLRSSSPLVRGAVVKGTANFVEPVLEGIGKFADFNEHLARNLTSHMNERVPAVVQPYYSAFVSYIVVLFPIVLVASILIKLKRRLFRMTSGHFIVLGNVYLGLLSVGCLSASFLGSVDVLTTFRQSRIVLSQVLLLSHVFLYLIHFSLHLTLALRTHSRKAMVHAVLILLVGLDFGVNCLHPSKRADVGPVGKVSYFWYSAVFCVILVQLLAWRLSVYAERRERGFQKGNCGGATVMDLYLGVAKIGENAMADGCGLPYRCGGGAGGGEGASGVRGLMSLRVSSGRGVDGTTKMRAEDSTAVKEL